MGTTTTDRRRTPGNRWNDEDQQRRLREAGELLREAAEHVKDLEVGGSDDNADRRFLQARGLVAAALHELRRLGPTVH